MSTKSSYLYDKKNDLHIYADGVCRRLHISYKDELLELPKPLMNIIENLIQYRESDKLKVIFDKLLEKHET